MREFQPDVGFRLEQIGRSFGGLFSFWRDGSQLTFVLQRGKETVSLHKQEFLWGNDRADVSLVDLRTGAEVVNLTHGLTRT